MNIILNINENQIFKEQFLGKIFLLAKHPQVSVINIIVKTIKEQLSERIQILTFLYNFMNIFVNDYSTSTNIYFNDLINLDEFKVQYNNKLLCKIQYIEQLDLIKDIQVLKLDGKIDLDTIRKYVKNFEEIKFEYDIKINNFQSGAMGGTFNFLHNGHKLLLSLGSLNCKNKLTVGVTNDSMIQKKKSQSYYIENHKTRQKNVVDFLKIFDKNLKVEILDLQDSMDGWNLDYDVLIVSEETQKAIEIFNNKRKEYGLKDIKGSVLKLIQQDGVKLGSTQIREYLNNNLDQETMLFYKKQFGKSLNINIDSLYLIENLFYKLLLFYSQKHRYYHNIDHIINVLDQIEKINDLQEKDLYIIIISLFFHDIIHHPQFKNNEKLSADFFEVQVQKLGTLKDSDIKRISKIIQSTESHGYCKNDQLQNIINDLDMSILGQQFQKYKKYVQLIRQEYSMIENFEQKRSEFLKSILQQSQGPFHCEYFSNQLAHQNMKKELEEYNQFIFNNESLKSNYLRLDKKSFRIRILIIKQNNLALINKLTF